MNDGILFYLVCRLGPFVLVTLFVIFVFAIYVRMNPWTLVVLRLLFLVAASAEQPSHGFVIPADRAKDADPNTFVASLARRALP